MDEWPEKLRKRGEEEGRRGGRKKRFKDGSEEKREGVWSTFLVTTDRSEWAIRVHA